MKRGAGKPNQSWRFGGIVAGTLLGLSFCLPAVAAGDGNGGKPPGGSGTPIPPALAAQIPLELAADRIQDLVGQRHLSGFTAAKIADSRDRLELYWKGSQPDEIVQRLVNEIRSEGTEVEVVSAPFSLVDLNLEEGKVFSTNKANHGVIVTGVEPLPKFDGLMVSVQPSLLPQAPSIVRSSMKLEFKAMPLATNFYARWDDYPSFWGGAMMDSGNVFTGYTYCSSGFGVTNPLTGLGALITANHCGSRSWATPVGNQHIGVTGPGQPSVDATLVTGESYGNCVYTSVSYNGSTSHCVVGYGNPALNADVLASGAASGASTVRVSSSNTYVADDEGNPVGPGFWTTNMSDVPSVGSGDSGGPVVSIVNTTTARARGMIIKGDPSLLVTTCIGWQGEGRVCSVHTFHVFVSSILQTLGVTLNIWP